MGRCILRKFTRISFLELQNNTSPNYGGEIGKSSRRERAARKIDSIPLSHLACITVSLLQRWNLR